VACEILKAGAYPFKRKKLNMGATRKTWKQTRYKNKEKVI
jgi:hypothetical protein